MDKKLPTNLKSNRKKIDQIDAEILELLGKRSQLVINAGKIKEVAGDSSYYRPEREAQLIRNLINRNKSEISQDGIKQIFKEIISACFVLEKNIKVFYLGPKGTFSELAVSKQFGNSVEKVNCPSIEDVFSKVEENENFYGIIPIENSTEGPVNLSLDCLMNSNLKICSELEVPIKHCLLSKENNLDSIKLVYGHSQAIAQCRNWIRKNLPNAKTTAVISSGKAAELSKTKKGVACIGHATISEIYKLKILKKNIEDQKNNVTRFLVIGDLEPEKSGIDKTSIILKLKNKQGILFKILKEFDKNKVNLTNILSRPVKNNKWQYSFFLEFNGHKSEKKIERLLSNLTKLSEKVDILGSYPNSS